MFHFKTQLIISSLIWFSIHDVVFAPPSEITEEVQSEITEEEPAQIIKAEPVNGKVQSEITEKNLKNCKDELRQFCNEVIDLKECLINIFNNLPEENSYTDYYFNYLLDKAIALDDAMTISEYSKMHPEIFNSSLESIIQKYFIDDNDNDNDKKPQESDKVHDFLIANLISYDNKENVISWKEAEKQTQKFLDRYINAMYNEIQFKEKTLNFSMWCDQVVDKLASKVQTLK